MHGVNHNVCMRSSLAGQRNMFDLSICFYLFLALAFGIDQDC